MCVTYEIVKDQGPTQIFLNCAQKMDIWFYNKNKIALPTSDDLVSHNQICQDSSSRRQTLADQFYKLAKYHKGTKVPLVVI